MKHLFVDLNVIAIFILVLREYFIGRKLAYKQKEVDEKNLNSRVKFKSVHLILNRTKAMQNSKNRL